MIPPGKFNAELFEVEQLLQDCSLLKERNVGNRKRLGAAELAGLEYKEQWEKLTKANDYDFKLINDAILSFQLVYESGDVRYVWLESPRVVETFGDFARGYVLDVMGVDQLAEPQVEALIEEFTEDITAAYEVRLAESPLKLFVTPLRYEFHRTGYKKGWHPISHVHVGQNYDIRLGCAHVLTPLAFTLFVMRQMYCEKWKELLNSGWALANRHRAREMCEIPSEFKTDLDCIELWLV